MYRWLLCGVALAACGTSSDDVANKEPVLVDSFDMFPMGWELTGVAWDGDVGLEWDIGDSPPSAFLAWDNDATSKTRVPYATQTLEAGVDAGILLEAPGMQALTLLLQDEAASTIGYVTLRMFLNDGEGSPNAGYPDGTTLEATCGFGAPSGTQATPLQASTALHALHISIDERGARCGVDGMDLATSALEAVDATVTLKLDAARLHEFQGKARVDNVRLLRGTP